MNAWCAIRIFPAGIHLLIIICLASFSLPSHGEQDLLGASLYSDLSKKMFFVTIRAKKNKGEKIDPFNNKYPREIELKIIADKYFPRQFSQIWIHGSAINSSDSEFDQNGRHIIELSECIKGNLKRGDILLMQYDPSSGLSLTINGVFIHAFEGLEFFNVLLNVLIGDVPLLSDMKDELASGKTPVLHKDDMDLYQSLYPTKLRVNEIKSWMAPRKSTTDKKPSENGIARQIPDSIPSEPNTSALSHSKTTQPKRNITKAVSSETANKSGPSRVKASKSVASETKPPTTSKKDLTSQKVTKAIQAGASKPSNIDPNESPSLTRQSIVAERDFFAAVKTKLESNAAFPIVVSSRLEPESIRVTITLSKNGEVLNIRHHDATKYTVLKKGAEKLIEKSAPYRVFPPEIKEKSTDLDFFFGLHWRYRK